MKKYKKIRNFTFRSLVIVF